MPREVTDIKQFLEIARRKDATSARIKKSSKPGQNAIKFKIRAHRFLYTLTLDDAKTDRADKLKQSLPPSLKVEEINKKTKKTKKA
ncbi:60S ribosomal protein L38 [Exophiala xenobiotica]|uniref:60S ribosomal protein L38 n=1 Tax=Lithohypha guttulata TaxID=1690604 RepID=A0ABR0KNR9_9EURO|nr:60S ribosomal protein L38 [Lithohypha guttulata]KAK5329192.1 60S ribosomal protein L38 [Exophiala xenobiotica]